MTPTLAQLDRCFQRILPGVIATADADGVPNVNYVSQLVVVDERHLALSYQFATKTRANLAANPRAALEVYDPLTLDAYRLELRLARVETAGPSFDLLAARITALASHTGLADVFKLRAAYVCEVLAIERRAGFIAGPDVAPPPARDPLAEAAGLMRVSERIAAAADLDGLLVGALAALADGFGFHHGRILVPDGDGRLVTIASHGYADGAGGEVRVGEGLIGVVAQTRRLVRALGIDADLRYARELRAEIARGAGASRLAPEVPLPGLPDARSQLALPLLAHDRLLGVLALESRDTLTFAQWHEPFLQVLANQIALSMEHMAERDDDEPPAPSLAPPPLAHRARTFCYYANDDCVFVDDAYLVRNVPGKILWKLLRAFAADGRTAWSNRELRLDPTLGLPALKDNLESRLILLRKRLADKCPELALVPTRRGHFRLEVACRPTLIERASA
ncbi:MAG: GAF domain-containing protein [Myxococcales bacterium]|nr:GAF domain-containing protein [Myxococcales bacterium]